MTAGRKRLLCAVSVGLLLPFLISGCADYWGVIDHYKDNPIDNSLYYSGGASVRAARARLLEKLPPGRPVSEVRDYLKSIGARCEVIASKENRVVCHYTQWRATEFRHPFGAHLVNRQDFRFRIELVARNERVQDFLVCVGTVGTHYDGGEVTRKSTTPMRCKDPTEL